MLLKINKEQLRTWFLLAIFIILAAFLVIQVQYTIDLEYELDVKNDLINDIEQRDSINKEEIKNYAETIDKYVSDGFFINGKDSLSAHGLVVYADYLLEENEWLNKEYYKTMDELIELLNQRSDDSLKLDVIKRTYGINYRFEKVKDGSILVKDFNKADSALLLLDVFRDRLKKDPKTGYWTIRK